MKVRFNGIRRLGTLRPRRMWSPGEELEVEDDVAEELADQPGFTILRRPPKKRAPKRSKVQETEVEESAEDVGPSTVALEETPDNIVESEEKAEGPDTEE